MSPPRDQLRYYFSFNDPYSFLITPAVKQLGHDYKIEIDYIPLPGFDRSGLFDDDEKIRRYFTADAIRFAEAAGRKLIYDDRPQDSLAICRGKKLADENMVGLKYINLLFAHRWVATGDISDKEAVIAALKFLEMNEEKLAAAMGGEGGAATMVEENVKRAAEDGVIGVPFFTFRGEPFFGADRLESLTRRLAADPSLTVHHDASYAVIKPEELAAAIEKEEPLLLLDIRIPKDFGAGHIPGANCLPARVVPRNLARLDRDWRIILVDDGGVEASETGFYLAAEGFKNISLLSGGYPAWRGAIETGLDQWQDRLKEKVAT